jgi:multidrug efflux pump
MRAERLTPEQLAQIYVTGSAPSNGPAGRLVPLSTFASLKTTAEPRDLKKFQQLNAVRIQGVIPPPVPLDRALGFLEDEARKILPQGFTIDYAGESRQLRTEGGKFLGTFLRPRFSSIPCRRRSSRASAIRSSSSLDRCRSRCRAP